MQLPEEQKSSDHISPEIIAKWKAESELTEAHSRNVYTATLKQLLEGDNQILLSLMQEIDPLDKEEMQLQHDIEYLAMELALLKAYLTVNNVDLDIQPLRENYLKQLAELKDIFMSSYQERLKSRESIFMNGNITPITDDLRNELLTSLRSTLEVKLVHLRESFMAILASPMALFTREAELQKLLDAKKREIDALIAKKTGKAERYNDIQNEMTEKAKNFAQEKLKHEMDFCALCFIGDKAMIETLLKKNPKLLVNQANDKGELPLHRACEAGHVAVVKLLIEKGADPYKQDEAKGLTAFHYACMQENMELLEYLYSKYKNKGFQTLGRNHRTVLHSAVFVNNLMATAWIINKKLVDIHAKDSLKGATPLHLAAWLNYPDMIHYLISAGANPHVSNHDNDSAVYEAVLNRRTLALTAFMKEGYCATKKDFDKLANYLPNTDERYAHNLKMWYSCIEAAHRIYMPKVAPVASSILSRRQATSNAEISSFIGVNLHPNGAKALAA